MSKGIIGFIVGLAAVLAGAFVATLLLKNKLAQKDDEDDFDDFDSFDDLIDEDESFFDEDDLPEEDEDAVAPETVEVDEGEKEEQL